MINNRQNGRRRGRGGQRPQGNPGQPGGGNRIDNRARGNAQQLHEKYKNLAQDAQRSGDRVTTEYYLQFADHYFRVLSESRARFEEQRPQQQQAEGDEEFDGEDGDEFEQRDYRQPRQHEARNDNRQNDGRNDNRRERGERQERGERNFRRDEQRERQPEPGTGENEERVEQPAVAQGEEVRRTRRPRQRREEADQPIEALDADRLPPALSIATEGEPTEAAPRRRTRRPRIETANDVVEVPPAA